MNESWNHFPNTATLSHALWRCQIAAFVCDLYHRLPSFNLFYYMIEAFFFIMVTNEKSWRIEFDGQEGI